MALPLNPRRTYSTSEYFRIARPRASAARYFKTRLIRDLFEKNWIEDNAPAWHDGVSPLRPDKPYIKHFRVRAPPTSDTELITKTRSRNSLGKIATLNEAQLFVEIKRYYRQHKRIHQHIPIPEVFAFSDPEETGNPGTLAIEYKPGLRNYTEAFPNNDSGWSRRQQRRFVRQMALMRLQMLDISYRKIGTSDPQSGIVCNPAIHARKDHYLRDKKGFINHLGPFRGTGEWVLASLQREHDYWRGMSSEEFTGITVPPEPALPDREDFCRSIKRLITELKGRGVHRFRDETEFYLTHNKLDLGRSILMDGKKIGAVVDWDCSAHEPLSEAVRDLFGQFSHNGFPNTDEWVGRRRGLHLFSAARYQGHTWEAWLRNMKANWEDKHLWEPPEELYKMFGTITDDDFTYGDKYADQDIPEDDFPGGGWAARHRNPILLGKDNDPSGSGEDQPLLSSDWWYGPVLYLMDNYLVNVKGLEKTWKWQDPAVLEWAQTPIPFGKKCSYK